jgi:hypothetical protein
MAEAGAIAGSVLEQVILNVSEYAHASRGLDLVGFCGFAKVHNVLDPDGEDALRHLSTYRWVKLTESNFKEGAFAGNAGTWRGLVESSSESRVVDDILYTLELLC